MNIAEKLKINPEETARSIESFIREQVEEFGRRGVAIPFSGGLDSSTVSCLSINGVGKDKVDLVILPEKQGNPEAEKYAKLFAERFDIRIKKIEMTKTLESYVRLFAEKSDMGVKKIDMTKTLESLGVYKSPIAYIPKRFREGVAKKAISFFKKKFGEHPFIHSLSGEDDRLIAKNKACIKAKHRVRMVYLQKHAEENNLLTIGCAHKSESLIGCFVNFGIDDAAEVMPLKNLYKTQIYQLANYLGVPREIIERSPNPDMIPGVKDKYLDIYGISSDKMDIILYGLENNIDEREIAEEAGVGLEKVKEIIMIKEKSRYMREPARAPVFSF